MQSALKLRGCIKNYEWGKIGFTSSVAQLYNSAYKDAAIWENTPYAELWMGTHSSGCSTIPEFSNIALSEWLSSHPEQLGNNITSTFGSTNGLPFLFKVLSVKKSLSIQVHPDKKTAEMLFNKFPERYPDDNHKPEIAIALTDFQVLCGFRPLFEIQTFLNEIPQLEKLIGPALTKKFTESSNDEELKNIFTTIMTCSQEIFQPLLIEIVHNFKSGEYDSILCKSVRDVFLRVSSAYPGDIGSYCIFFFNFISLKPGEAIYLAANEPHAYLYGDCIECMACSDNVVRAGLSPKFKDVETLCKILTYNCKSAKENVLPFEIDEADPCVKIFNPPVKEFSVDQITVPSNHTSYGLKPLQSASILLVVKGDATYICKNEKNNLSTGTVLFIASNSKVDIFPSAELLMFRAYCSG